MHVRKRDTSTMSSVCVQSARTQPQPPSPSLTPPAPEGAPGLSSHPSPCPHASSLHFLGWTEHRTVSRFSLHELCCDYSLLSNRAIPPPALIFPYIKSMWPHICRSAKLTNQKETNPKPHLSSKKIHVKLNQLIHRQRPESHSSDGNTPPLQQQ